MATYPLFVAGTMSGPTGYDPYTPITVGPVTIDPNTGGVSYSGPGLYLPYAGGPGMGFQAPVGPVTTGMPTPVSVPAGKCALHKPRRINWCNPRALARASRRINSFTKHVRKYVKVSRKTRTFRRGRRRAK